MRKLLFLLLSGCSLNTFAVEGYKDLKFGATIDEVRHSKLCRSVWEELEPNSQVWRCTQFTFGDKPIKALIRFTDQKLTLINLVLQPNERDRIRDGLIQKYGTPSQISANIELQQALPIDQKWFMLFEHDTVRLMFIPAVKVNSAQGQTTIPAQLNIRYQKQETDQLVDDL